MVNHSDSKKRVKFSNPIIELDFAENPDELIIGNLDDDESVYDSGEGYIDSLINGGYKYIKYLIRVFQLENMDENMFFESIIEHHLPDGDNIIAMSNMFIEEEKYYGELTDDNFIDETLKLTESLGQLIDVSFDESLYDILFKDSNDD